MPLFSDKPFRTSEQVGGRFNLKNAIGSESHAPNYRRDVKKIDGTRI